MNEENDAASRLMRAVEIYARHRERPGPAERQEMLLRHPELADLLEAMFEQGSGDSVDTGSSIAAFSFDEFESIGEYQVEGLLGSGGMGAVFLARRERPPSIHVALKLIHADTITELVLRRFHREREILAQMHHPDIARIFDAGRGPWNHPYFVMEYVEDGLPITRYCDEARMGIPDRLRLFCRVCNAIQYAHWRGVIHRDLKPSNLLVTEVDGEPQPKVIDFGIARAMDLVAEDGEALTRHGQILGTIEYMSPEQGEGLADIDTRTDIYSLGVILYELLSGYLPFERRARDSSRIGKATPLRPSTCVSRRHRSKDVTTRTTAARRRLDPPRLARCLRGDLDCIVMKAIESDRERRYASPSELAEDIDRHLARLPIRATPLTPWTHIRAVWRTHRALLCAVLPITLALTIGGVGTFVAREEARKQLVSAEEAHIRAEEAEQGFLDLASLLEMRSLTQRAEELWPAGPEMVGELHAWVVRAGRFRDVLARLRMRDAGQHSVEFHEEAVEECAAFVEAPEVSWLTLGTTLPEVERRVAFAERIEERSITGTPARDLWSAVVPGVPPQLGLLPIGRDPDSRLWEFAHLASGEPPERDTNGYLVLTEETGLVFVLIPGGPSWLGTQRSDPQGRNYDPDALPEDDPARCEPMESFFLSKYEMTQAQWLRLTGVNPAVYSSARSLEGEWHTLRNPVENVTWTQCVEVLERIDLRLPAVDEWEHAARAGTQTPWWTGREGETLQGAENIADHSFLESRFGEGRTRLAEWDDGFITHAPAGTFRANPFGLHDMLGNVGEWCLDGVAAFEELETTAREISVREHLRRHRVARGGSWRYGTWTARVIAENVWEPQHRSSIIGIRPARSIHD